MVGVAGRSKGCVTCRQRRVKCDETQPTCDRCRKANRVCGGYLQNNFIDGLPSKIRKQRRREDSAPLPSTQDVALVVRQSASRSPHPEVEGDESLRMPRRDVWSPGSSSESDASDRSNSIPEPLGLAGFQDTIFVTYTSKNLLKGASPINGPALQHLTKPGGQLAMDCLVMISTIYFGNRHHQDDIIRLGLQRYGKNLRKLNLALAHPVHSKSIYVLDSVLTMTLFEFLNPSSMYGWIHHALGIERLFVHRGPYAAHRNGTDLSTFENIRPTIVFACLATNRPCLLASDEWCTVPWSRDPAAKNMLQRLLDILVHVPPLLGTTTQYWGSANPTLDELEALLDANLQLKVALRRLDEWWAAWCAQHGDDDYWGVPLDTTGLAPDAVPELWSTIYHFRHLFLANEFANYHATRLLCLGLSRSIDALDPSGNPDELHHMACEARRSGVEVCRSVDFHLLPQHDGAGSIYLMYPLRMTWKGIGGDGKPEGRWLRGIANEIGKGMKGGWAGLPDLLFGNYEMKNGLLGVRDG